MFVKNGLAGGGITLSDFQKQQLDKFRLFNKIWVLDNAFIDKEGGKKTRELIEQGETVFVYPEDFRQCKDLNEICVKYELDYVSPKFILKNSFKGMEALLKLNN